jgi:hypothetical protein
MTRRDMRATTAGVLLIAATAASLTATACFGSSLDGSNFLTNIAAHQNRMLTGALFELIGAFASAAIAVSLYPVLRQHGPAMALGAVGFRLIEGTFYALSAVSILVLVTLAGDAATGGSLQVSADVMRTLHESTGLAGILAFYIGGTLYYLVFYRSRLIPRWLSVWGLVGTTLGAAAGVLVLFQTLSLLSAVHTLLNVPIGVQELVLAVWLLVKGFTASAPPALAPPPSLTGHDAKSPGVPPLPVTASGGPRY